MRPLPEYHPLPSAFVPPHSPGLTAGKITPLSAVMKAVAGIRSEGKYEAVITKPGTGRIHYSLNSAYQKAAMKTNKIAFENIREQFALSATVFRESSLTGTT